MCGRFLLRSPPESWPADLFGDLSELNTSSDFVPRKNICPTQDVLGFVQTDVGQTPELRSFRWGLIPHWAKDRSIGAKMINARAETVDEKPSFRVPFSRRRCLVVADGYYEWVKTPGGKQPMLIERPEQQLFLFAGLWDRNVQVGDEPTVSCTIITTAANESMAATHDRMPVVIQPTEVQRWLDPGFRDTSALKSLLQAADDGYFKVTPVDRVPPGSA